MVEVDWAKALAVPANSPRTDAGKPISDWTSVIRFDAWPRVVLPFRLNETVADGAPSE